MALFDFTALPGLKAATETAERMFLWGKHEVAVYSPGIILSSSTDPGNTPTTELRAGLAMAKLSTGKWVPYESDAVDGSEVAAGVLTQTIKMTDLGGTARDQIAVLLVAGPVKGGQLLYKAPVASSSTLTGLDQQARAQLRGKMIFDDDLVGNLYPWKHWITKAADYTVVAADNGTVFEAITGAVTFTLPALLDANSNPVCKGMRFKFVNAVDANMIVQRAGSDTIIADGNAAAVSITFSTSSHKIGGIVEIETNTAGTKWVANILTNATATIA